MFILISFIDVFKYAWSLIYSNFFSMVLYYRITVSNNKYRVINLPPKVNLTSYDQFRLGKSVNGVHFAVDDGQQGLGQQGLQVWFLGESGSKTEWVLKHVTRYPFNHDQTDRP